MVDLSFQDPVAFFLGGLMLLFGLLSIKLNLDARRQRRDAYGDEKLLGKRSPQLSWRNELTRFAVWALIMVALTVAWARPVMQGQPTQVRAGSVDVVIVSDVSRSMAAEEYRPFMPPRDGASPESVRGAYGSRLDYIKYTIEARVLAALSGNRLGIVTYSGLGYNQADLTGDFPSLRWILRHWMPVGGAPGNGSDFAKGLREALALFDTAGGGEERRRVIVLFSDGGFTGSEQELREVTAELARRQIHLLIVGVGGDIPAPIPVYARSGELRGYLQKDGQALLTRFEEEPLLRLRAATGAEMIRLAPGDNLEVNWASVLGGSSVEIGTRHLYAYPLALALFLFAFVLSRCAVRT